VPKPETDPALLTRSAPAPALGAVPPLTTIRDDPTSGNSRLLYFLVAALCWPACADPRLAVLGLIGYASSTSLTRIDLLTVVELTPRLGVWASTQTVHRPNLRAIRVVCALGHAATSCPAPRCSPRSGPRRQPDKLQRRPKRPTCVTSPVTPSRPSSLLVRGGNALRTSLTRSIKVPRMIPYAVSPGKLLPWPDMTKHLLADGVTATATHR
jgi:hypothetical protein